LIGFGLFLHRLGDEETGRTIASPNPYDFTSETIKSFNNEWDCAKKLGGGGRLT